MKYKLPNNLPNNDETQKIIENVERRIQNDENAIDIWLPHVAPTLYGNTVAKQASLLWASSLDKIGPHRGRIHMLNYGEKGSGKTLLLEFWTEELGCETMSNRSTKASLTATLNRRNPEPGLLAKSNTKGYLTIDELHEVKYDQQQSMLQAMESGWYHVSGAGYSAKLPARSRIMSCCNRVDKFSPEFLDRFDLKVRFKKYSTEEMKKIVGSIIDSGSDESANSHNSGLGKYIYSLRSFVPEMNVDMQKRTRELIDWIIDETPNISIRESLTFYRAIYAAARLNMRNITEQDVAIGINICLDVAKTKDTSNDLF